MAPADVPGLGGTEEKRRRHLATGDQVLVDATGPNPAPDLAVLRQDLDAAGLAGLDVRVSLVTVSYQPLPK